MTSTKITLQSIILRLLSQPQIDKHLGRGEHYFTEAVLSEYPKDKQPSVQLIAQTLWSLLGRGLIYINEQGSLACAAIRDTLSSKLLSGEILIKDTEKFVEKAL